MKVLYSKKNGITNKLSGVNLPVDADEINYDNTESELQSTNVQDAIDEVNSGKISKSQTAGLVKNNGTIDTENYSDEIDAIVNVYGGKNLLKYPYRDLTHTDGDLIWTSNSDGTINVNGSNTSGSTSNFYFAHHGTYKVSDVFPCAGKYYVSCGGRTDDIGCNFYIADNYNDILPMNGKEYTITDAMMNKAISFFAYVTTGITISSTIIYPMIRDARISDDTYVPYSKTNLELTKDASAIDAIVNIYGSKNLFPDFIESQTYKGITWTRNADSSITVNGTADGWSTRTYSGSIKLKAGTYVLSSGLSWPDCYNVYAELNYNDGTSHVINTSQAEEVTFTLANDTEIPTVQVVVRSKVTVSNITIKPMLRDARISDSTYVPYAMTNRELTKALTSTGVIYSESTGVFRIPDGVPTPFQGNQYVVCARSAVDGSIYALWYDATVTGFRLATTLFGNAPTDGLSVAVQYLS